MARTRLALAIVDERFKFEGLATSELRLDLIGADAVRRGPPLPDRREPAEVTLRVAGRTAALCDARRIGNEVETLYTNGPAGGAWSSAREILAVASTLVPRDLAFDLRQLRDAVPLQTAMQR